MITAKQLKEFLATVEDNALIFIGKSGGMSYGCQDFMVKKELFIEKEDQFLDSLIWDHDFDDEEIEKLEKEAIERQAVYLQYYPGLFTILPRLGRRLNIKEKETIKFKLY